MYSFITFLCTLKCLVRYTFYTVWLLNSEYRDFLQNIYNIITAKNNVINQR